MLGERVVLRGVGALILACLPGGVFADPSVPGHLVQVYAAVTDPTGMAFDASGALFVGRDASGSGGGTGDPVKIHRIGPGGSPVTEYGVNAIPDPDAVAVDLSGSISGVPGAVLVGGNDISTGKWFIDAIHPDQSIVHVFGPTLGNVNPADIVFDHLGRLLFTGQESRDVWASSGSFPTQLITTVSSTNALAIDSNNQIFVSRFDGVVSLYAADGSLLSGTFASGLGSNIALAIGPGGTWGTDLYALKSSTGELLRFTGPGISTVVGTGFDPGTSSLRFGPDGALYAAEFNSDRVLRIAPAATPAQHTSWGKLKAAYR
jgi:hypothetical protein